MSNRFFKRIISLSLVLVILLSLSLSLVSCLGSGSGSDNGQSDSSGEDINAGNTGGSENSNENYRDKIISLPFKDFERGTVNFDEISYERPNFEAAIASFESVIGEIKKNEIDFDAQISLIKGLEASYTNILTMQSISNIYNSKADNTQLKTCVLI